jgi:hypothetical protein
MSSPRIISNRWLIAMLVATAVLQTALPIVGQKFSREIIYPELLRASVMFCLLAGISVAASYLAGVRRASIIGLAMFYVGLLLLAGFDFWIEKLIRESC